MEPLRHLRPLPSTTAGLRSTCFDRLPYGCLLFMYRLDLTSGTSNFARSHSCTGSKTPGRGGSRDTHETDTRTSQTNLKTNPTHRLTRQTTPKPRDARVATHHTTHPIKRGGGDDGDGATAPGRGSSEGASPTASVTALLRVPGGAEVSGFGIRKRLIALMVHARRQGPGMTYARCTGIFSRLLVRGRGTATHRTRPVPRHAAI